MTKERREKIKHFFVLISILFLLYFSFLLIGMDFNLFLVKLKSMLLTKSLHFLFSRLGWCGGGLVIAVVLTIKDPELAKMMAPSGGAPGASGPSTSVDSVPQDEIWAALDQRPQAPAPAEATSIDQGPNRNEASSSGSGSWRQYLNLPSDNEGNASAAPSTDRTPSHPASEGTHCPPLSSRASTPSSSFFRGLSDAAPAPELGEEVQQVSPTHSISQTDLWNELSPSAPTPGQDNQPPLVVEQATPDPAPQEVPLRLRDFQHQAIKKSLATLTPQREVNDDQVDAIICLKETIVDRMAQLDPHPFWAEQKDYLVANGILKNNRSDYSIETLQKNLLKLTNEGQNSFFFF